MSAVPPAPCTQKNNAFITGFFQGVIRSTQAYDEASKDVIASEYARSTHAFHGCSPELLKTALLSTVDLIWAAERT